MRIVLGITGSIAAYKAASLVRLFVKTGHEVRVVATPDALHFISDLTLSTLSKHSVFSDFSKEGQWTNHVGLGLWADLMVIAPATANTLAKMAHGQCDNILLATYLSAKCPILFAPAMDLDMWKHPATQNNIALLLSYKDHHIIEVETGELASGLFGPGRMAEPEDIFDQVSGFFNDSTALKGQRVLITAGPTKESIDPVRFISNHSTGTMGKALSRSFAQRGADVTLIAGPMDTSDIPEGISCTEVVSAREMYEAVSEVYAQQDIVVFAAAVADFTPKHVHSEKVKKGDQGWNIALERTIDIAATLGRKKNHQFHIGFALESESGEREARAKMDKKHFDMIILNSLQNKGAGFGKSTNQITIFDRKGLSEQFPLKSKTEVAEDIVEYYINHFHS